jgi:acyl-CoA dehydrogenase
MQRDIFASEHDDFRDLVRAFIAKEVTPYHEKWEADKMVSRDVWLAAGRAGLLGIEIDEKYGGGGAKDYRYYLIFNEEMAKAGATGPGFAVHNDINGPYFQRLATSEQCERWLPGYCSGETITAIAMTEPEAGSDLQGMRTTAVRVGDHYVLNGSKTFISNGQLCDVVIVAARTDPDAGYQGISLLVVERGMPGFERGRNLDKVGMHAQDTSELFFHDVRVPDGIGRRGGGVRHHSCVLQGTTGFRPGNRKVPAQQVRARRDRYRACRGAGVHRQGGAGTQRGQPVGGGRGDGEVVGHRAVQPRR